MRFDYDQKLYHKTLVCDIDDTISLTTTRDWENAEPLWPTINRVNELYDDGWQIILLTARGQLSCEGDTEKADKKYRERIESWLHKHGVKYHKLSFKKYLGAYYVDDKALTPEAFQELDIKTIKTGWSGAVVEKRGDRIYKTHSDSLNAAAWYKMASPLVNTPIVHNVIGNTICLEYLHSNGNKSKIDDIIKDIEKFSYYTISSIESYSYIQRMRKHCEANNDFWDIINLLENEQEILNKNNSFCHGDFSLENIIQTDKGMFLIDPIYDPNNWSSYLLDISKMMHSYRKYNRMFEYHVFMNYWINKGIKGLRSEGGFSLEKDIQYILQLLEVSQFIRVVKYIPDPELKKEYHEWSKQLLSQIKNNKILKT